MNVDERASANTRDWDAICRFVHQCWVSFQLGAGQPYNAEPDEEDLRSNRTGVEFVQNHPDAGPSAQHDLWIATRLADGWACGPIKDKEKKTHPDLVPFESLPASEQAKDACFLLAAKLALRLFPEREVWSDE
ncbi:MAG: RyR domain-containing protein [Chloroflexi bacterium]|nr:RyR domain-containing protein [Chloroflexota bacterium]